MSGDDEFSYYDDERGTSSGWSGSGETSKDRVHWLDESGKTRTHKEMGFKLLEERGPEGATSREFGEWSGLGHESFSQTFSNMHKDGEIAKIDVKRRNSGVYVLHECVLGRTLIPHKPHTESMQAQRLRAVEKLVRRSREEGDGRVSADTLEIVLKAKKFKNREKE